MTTYLIKFVTRNQTPSRKLNSWFIDRWMRCFSTFSSFETRCGCRCWRTIVAKETGNDSINSLCMIRLYLNVRRGHRGGVNHKESRSIFAESKQPFAWSSFTVFVLSSSILSSSYCLRWKCKFDRYDFLNWKYYLRTHLRFSNTIVPINTTDRN